MRMKGKIYAKYLKRAKYVVKGRRLKSPIATISKRIMPVQNNVMLQQNGVVQNNANVMQNKVAQNNNAMMQQNGINNPQFSNKPKVVNSNDVVNKKGQKENDISFSELGKKIVDGEEKDKNSDSKTVNE